MATPANAEQMQRMVADPTQLPAFDQSLGFRLESWQPEGATMAATADTRWQNPYGRTHGGYLTALMDSTMGLTITGWMAPNQCASNVELQSRFLRPARGTLRATAAIAKRGRTIWILSCQVTDETRAVVATAESTFVVSSPVLPNSHPSVK